MCLHTMETFTVGTSSSLLHGDSTPHAVSEVTFRLLAVVTNARVAPTLPGRKA